MLGKVVQRKRIAPQGRISTRLKDFIINNWKEDRSNNIVSLEKKENTYDEFWFSPSSIHNMCPRMYALACAQKGAISETLKPQTLWLFGLGHAYHDLMQNGILPELPDGVFQGSWERHVKATPEEVSLHPSGNTVNLFSRREVVTGTQMETMPNIERGWCPVPKYEGYPAPRWRYVEPKFRDHEYRFVGKCDGVLRWTDFSEVQDIKSERLDAREELDPILGGKPRPKHVKQVQSYIWQFGVDRGRIVYVLKGENLIKDAIIEYVVERDDVMIEGIKKDLKASIAAITKIEVARTAGQEVCFKPETSEFDALYPPVLEGCSSRSDVRAKKCPIRAACIPIRRKKKSA